MVAVHHEYVKMLLGFCSASVRILSGADGVMIGSSSEHAWFLLAFRQGCVRILSVSSYGCVKLLLELCTVSVEAVLGVRLEHVSGAVSDSVTVCLSEVWYRPCMVPLGSPAVSLSLSLSLSLPLSLSLKSPRLGPVL